MKAKYTFTYGLVLLKKETNDINAIIRCLYNLRSANVADNTNSANETDNVERSVREESKRLPQEWKEVVALSYGLCP